MGSGYVDLLSDEHGSGWAVLIGKGDQSPGYRSAGGKIWFG